MSVINTILNERCMKREHNGQNGLLFKVKMNNNEILFTGISGLINELYIHPQIIPMLNEFQRIANKYPMHKRKCINCDRQVYEGNIFCNNTICKYYKKKWINYDKEMITEIKNYDKEKEDTILNIENGYVETSLYKEKCLEYLSAKKENFNILYKYLTKHNIVGRAIYITKDINISCIILKYNTNCIGNTFNVFLQNGTMIEYVSMDDLIVL